jgi:nucleotide-binding universal stress UspA family protein
MKRILVPCDFSETSLQAFQFAIEIARKSGGRIMLLHIVELPVLHDTMLTPTVYLEADYFKDLKAHAEKKFVKMKSKCLKEQIKVTSFVKLGPIPGTINGFAEEHKADLIVMGTQGATGLLDFFIGSNTEKVVRRSSIPVLVVRKSFKLNTINKILYPTTLLQEENHLVKYVKKLQDFFSATLYLLIVNTPHNLNRTLDEQAVMEKFAQRHKLTNYTINTKDNFYVANAIIDFAHEIKADMIVMGTHGRKGLSHLFMGSVAENVVNHLDCAIWTYPIKK